MAVCASLQVGTGCAEGTTRCDPSGNGHRQKCVSNAWVDQGADATCSSPSSTYPAFLSLTFNPTNPQVGQVVQIIVDCKAGSAGNAAGLQQKLLINGTVSGTSDPLQAIPANQEFQVTWTTSSTGFNAAGTYNICAQWVGDTATLCANLTVGNNPPPPSGNPTFTDMTFAPASPNTSQAEVITVSFTSGASGNAAGLLQELLVNGVVKGTSSALQALEPNTAYNVTWSTNGAPFAQTAGTYAVCVRWKPDTSSGYCKNLVVTPIAGCTEGNVQCDPSGNHHQQKCVGGAWTDQGCNAACGGCVPGQITCDANKHQITCNADGCGTTDGGVTSRCNPVCTDGEVGPCNGFQKTVCQNNAWVPQGCSTDCGATCTQDGATKCVDGNKYLCQNCTYINQGADATCTPTPPCNGVTVMGTCIDQTMFIAAAAVAAIAVGAVVVLSSKKKKGGSGGFDSESGTLGSDLDQDWYGRIN